MRKTKGFTLIELLIVIGIIGFLAAAILVAVDPVKRIQDARDSRRYAEANSILSAILKKQVDDRALYNGESTKPQIISSDTLAQVIVEEASGTLDCDTETLRPGCNEAISTADGTSCVADLSDLVDGTNSYLGEIPQDPAGGQPCSVANNDPDCTIKGDTVVGTNNSGYYIRRSTNNRIEIGACHPEQEAAISVKR